METLIHAQRELWNDAIAIHMAERKPFGLCVAQPVTFVEQPEEIVSDPFMRLRIADAQRLMDELWHCGLRPSEGTGSAGSLKATENHLADMRMIAFTLLDRPNVKVSGLPQPDGD